MITSSPASAQITISLLPGRLAVCRLAASAPLPSWARSDTLLALVRTADELSIVCDEDCVPAGVSNEAGWRAWKVHGPLDFSLIGVLAGITGALADAGVSVFVLSTYETDYVLIKEDRISLSRLTLVKRGYQILDSGDI